MASLRKRGDKWYIEVTKNGQRKSKTFATNVNHEAVVPVVESYIRFYNYKRISLLLNCQIPCKA
jgi:hypothetical protein